jgi:two-component system response regulator FixJ
VTETRGEIHLVLPDPIERSACFRALASGAARIVRSFASAADYVETDADAEAAILLFHWRQPGAVGGAALLTRVAAREGLIAFVAADRLDVAEARAVLRGGAHDLLPAPLDPRRIKRTVEAALGDWHERRRARAVTMEAESRLSALTPRERDILAAIAAGCGNKAIARRLDLSPRTVEVHRANIMRRAGAANVAELLRLAFLAEQAESATGQLVRYGGGSGGAAADRAAGRL